MVKYFNFILIFWISIGVTGAFAQTSGPLEPTEPVLHRPPHFASWTIVYKYKGEEKETANQVDRVQSVTITKTNKTYREIAIFSSGKKREKWIFNGTQLMTVPDSGAIVAIPAPAGEDFISPEYSDYSKSDFEGLGWVSLETYKGVRNYEGKPAFLFEATKSGSILTAILSAETQLPLYFSDGNESRSYVYNSPPSVLLNPPERFSSVLQKHRKGLELLKRNPSPP